MDLSGLPSVVVVIHRPGCGACEEFLPRAHDAADRWRPCVPTAFLDALKNVAWCDQMQVQYPDALRAAPRDADPPA